MTVTNQIKILDDQTKSNPGQYVLGRKPAKTSALASKDLLEKYEYLTGKNLGHKPSVFEKAKSEYFPQGMTLINNTKNKTNKNKNKAYNKNKQTKNLIYNPQHSFAKYKDIDGYEELPVDSMYKRLNEFKKRFNKFKTLNPQTDKNKNLQEKALDDVGDLFNELYYIQIDKYNEEEYGLNSRDRKKFNQKKLRLAHDYQYESEEEREQQTSKKPDKTKLPKKPTKNDLKKLVNGLIKKKQVQTVNYLKSILMFKGLVTC